MDFSDPSDVAEWLEIVNSAYAEADYDLEIAKGHARSHPFLDVWATYFALEGSKAIGTMSIGVYKDNPRVGGASRLAVRPGYQGRGVGQFLVDYCWGELCRRGIRYGEAVFYVRRSQSMMLHFRSGFLLQRRRTCTNGSRQVRDPLTRYIANMRAQRIYLRYRRELAARFARG